MRMLAEEGPHGWGWAPAETHGAPHARSTRSGARKPVVYTSALTVRVDPVARCNGSCYKHGRIRHSRDKGCRRRRHHPMPALSPRTSASRQWHWAEPGHHAGTARGRAGHPRARPPRSSAGVRHENAREGLQSYLLQHRPQLHDAAASMHSWVCVECTEEAALHEHGLCKSSSC